MTSAKTARPRRRNWADLRPGPAARPAGLRAAGHVRSLPLGSPGVTAPGAQAGVALPAADAATSRASVASPRAKSAVMRPLDMHQDAVGHREHLLELGGDEQDRVALRRRAGS